MAKGNCFSLSNDERNILHFIWRMKVASTSAIYLRYKQDFNWKEFTAYSRLLILKKKGCIETRSDNSGSFRAWMLTAKGFKAIRHLLLALKEEGYASENISHDLHVMATHYGEWIARGYTPDVRFVTEQELRRIDGPELPAWARPLQVHKPDGVWYFPETKEKTIYALEVELSRKRSCDYKTLGEFYAEEKKIASVLWVVQSKGHATQMVSAFQSATNIYRDIHNFVLLDDLKKSGWACEIFLGPNYGTSIHNFLEKARRNQAITTPQPTHHRGCVEKMLNFRLKRFDSSTSIAAKV